MGMYLAPPSEWPTLGPDFRLIVASLTVTGAAASFEATNSDEAIEVAHFLREGFVRGTGTDIWWRDKPGHSLTIVHIAGAALRPELAVLGAAFLGCVILAATLEQVRRVRPLRAVGAWLGVVALIAAFGPLLPPSRSITMLTVRGRDLAAEIAGRSTMIQPEALAAIVMVPLPRRDNRVAFDIALPAKHGGQVLVFSCRSQAEARAIAALVNGWMSGTPSVARQ